jgi:hypothetical protein
MSFLQIFLPVVIGGIFALLGICVFDAWTGERLRRRDRVTRYKACEKCGTRLVSEPDFRGEWLEYPVPGMRMIHTAAACNYLVHTELLDALTEEDRAWLRENGWNGR